jgi:thiamine-monophosphate kinase
MKRSNEKAGELMIIEYIRSRYPRRRKEIVKGIGDDAMIFRNGFVVSTDSFFEGIHFDLGYFTMQALGFHVMAASLSDLAAMAAKPVCALISLNLTKRIELEGIKQLYSGFEKLSKKYRFDIAGGDVVASPAFGMTITVIGRTRRPLLRSCAVPEESLFVTNFLGLAETGRIVLQEDMVRSEYPEAVKKHLYPEPRISEAIALKKYINTCIDVSDGLSTDAGHLAHESDVKVIIEQEHVPIHAEVGRLCNKLDIDPMDFILSAGEDFELLFTASRLPKVPNTKVFKIGHVSKGNGIFLSVRGKEQRMKPTGYEHLNEGRT